MSTGQVERVVENANQTALAGKMGVTRNYVNLILNRKRVPTLPVAAKLAKELGVSLDDLNTWMGKESAAAVAN